MGRRRYDSGTSTVAATRAVPLRLAPGAPDELGEDARIEVPLHRRVEL
jgi:hypothetical protein